jgi:hypothetical protein
MIIHQSTLTWCRSFKAPARANREWSMNSLDGSSRSLSIFVHAMQTLACERPILRALLIVRVVGGAYPKPDDDVRHYFVSRKVKQSKFELTPAYSAFFVALFDAVAGILLSWSTYSTEEELALAWRNYLEPNERGQSERDSLYERATAEALKVLANMNAPRATARTCHLVTT